MLLFCFKSCEAHRLLDLPSLRTWVHYMKAAQKHDGRTSKRPPPQHNHRPQPPKLRPRPPKNPPPQDHHVTEQMEKTHRSFDRSTATSKSLSIHLHNKAAMLQSRWIKNCIHGTKIVMLKSVMLKIVMLKSREHAEHTSENFRASPHRCYRARKTTAMRSAEVGARKASAWCKLFLTEIGMKHSI